MDRTIYFDRGDGKLVEKKRPMKFGVVSLIDSRFNFRGAPSVKSLRKRLRRKARFLVTRIPSDLSFYPE